MVHYDGRIRLNKFYCLTNPEGVLGNTIPHEVSHLLAYSIHGRQGQGHGKLWADTFLLLKPGAAVTQCHNFGNVEEAKQKIQSVADQMLRELPN
jgi:predicted SprT family Zn-dependent metalloprotease